MGVKTSGAVWEGGAFFGGQGDTLSLGVIDVFSCAPALQAALPGYQAILCGNYIQTCPQFELTKRLLAPPLDGMQIVTGFFPHVAGGPRRAIQNLRALGSKSEPRGSGFTATLVHYQYTLLPRQDAAFSSMVHPRLRNQSQVPIEAVTLIVTFPVSPNSVTWTFGQCTISAPLDVFQQNKETYRGIFENVALEPQGLAAKIRNNEEARKLADAMNNITREAGRDWWLRLGGLAEPVDTAGDQGPIDRGNRPALPYPGSCPADTILYQCTALHPSNQLQCLKNPPQSWQCKPIRVR